MAAEVKLPDLGEGVESGDVLEILVSEGEAIDKDQGILELETDKATVTIPSPVAGTIVSIAVKAGQTVTKGDLVATLDAAGAAAPAPAQEAPTKTPAPQPAASEPVAEPAQVEPAPAPVQAAPIQAAPEPVQAPPVQAPAPVQATAPVASPPAPVSDDNDSAVPAGPAVRRFAREVGVDLRSVTGTGEGARITREDVLRAVRQSSARPANTALTPASPPAATAGGTPSSMAVSGEQAQDDYGPVRVERLSKIRKTIAAQMHKSWSTVPRVTNFDDADVTELEAFRQSSKDLYAEQGIKLTTMPFLIKAVATALRMHPTVNATMDLENDQITYRDYVNVGIAVDTDRGLVVPNIRNVDSMGIPDIAKSLAELATRVRSGDFGVNELRGGTFTISNLGAIGGTYSTPIVNVPEVAILLIGRTRKLPVVMEDDSIEARQMMPLSLSYDHRLVDGGTAARFLNEIIGFLEAPSRLLLAIT